MGFSYFLILDVGNLDVDFKGLFQFILTMGFVDNLYEELVHIVRNIKVHVSIHFICTQQSFCALSLAHSSLSKGNMYHDMNKMFIHFHGTNILT